MKTSLTRGAYAVALSFVSTIGNAALVSRLDGQAVYDTDTNITWLADATAGATNNFGVGAVNQLGQMNWSSALSWIDGMNAASYLGFNDWRLPTADPVCGFNYNCTNSEMGHLFYTELGGAATQPISASTDPDLALFTHLYDSIWWINGPQVTDQPWKRWYFGFYSGTQSYTDGDTNTFAWAVRSGDVASVPIPVAIGLFGSGLLGLLGTAKRKASINGPMNIVLSSNKSTL